VQFETQNRTKTGELRDMLINVKTIMYQGKMAVIGIGHDITERKRAEEALREQNALRDGMLESLDFPFFAVDTAYRYLAFNQSHAAVMKALFDRDIEIGKSLLEYHTVLADREKAKTYLDQALKGEIIVVHEYAGDDQLSRRYFEILHCPIRDANDRIIGVAILARDITDRKRAEEALRESESKYRSLFEHMLNGLAYCQMLLDEKNAPVDFVYLEVNDAFERLIGLKKQEVIGKKATEAIPSIKDTHPELFNLYGNAALTGKETQFDLYFTPLDRWLSISVYSPQKGYFVAVFENITDRKQAEEALKTSEQNLQDLIYIASHDLQTPIVSMQGFISNLIKASASRLDEKGNYALQRLKVNAERLHRLVLSLLDLSRVSTVKNPYRTFDPVHVVHDLIKELELLVKQTGAEITIEPMPALRGDEPRLTSVLRNLLTNALHYGGKQIRVGYRAGAYFVQDDGIGIAPHNLAKIFRPGERLKQIEVDGVGMGLTFCQKVILQHQGRIWTESAGEGTGTTVYFTIGA